MKIRKLMAIFTASIAVYNNLSMLNVFAEEEKIKIEIENKIISTEELQAMNYEVPIFVNLTANAGINSAEFIINVDTRCDYEIITDSGEAFELANRYLLVQMTSSNKFYDNSCRLLWASADVLENIGAMALLIVRIPKDAMNGDIFEISYLPELNYYNYNFEHLWGVAGSGIKNYVTNNEVNWVNGSISIQDDKLSDSGILLGDVNLDGEVDIRDAVFMNRAVLGKEILTEQQLKAVDFNQNGFPEPDEALTVMKLVVKLITQEDLLN